MKRVAIILASISSALLASVGAWIAWPLAPSVLARPSAPGVTIVDRDGLVLRSTRAADGSQTRWVSYDRIDPDVINAFVAVEDKRFWSHAGVDARAVLRAVRDNMFAGHVVSGSSTITMQLARLLEGSSRRWRGKASQALWALRLEAHLSKQQILEQYLNRVQLGQATIGVGAASATYFDASPSELSVAQAAMLAGIAHAPSRDNPYSSARRARERRRFALRRMRQLGYATPEDVARAADEPLRTPSRATPFLAPHFTTRVLAWLADSVADATNDVTTVRTTLDLGLQLAVEAEVRHTVEMLHDRGVEQAAAVVLDNRSGDVLAWVGSPDFWSSNDGQTDMVISPRQPGSALKPFLYGLALDDGITAATVLPDLPKSFATATGSYAPRNYDRRFRGPVRAREALASSYNVPAVELASRVGVGQLLHTLQLAGFRSLSRDAEFYGLGLALGNGDVTLLELANGYRALAMDGEWSDWHWSASSAVDGVTSTRRDTRRVVSRMSSAILLHMLSDAEARIPAFGLETPFDFPFPVAVKTGTSRHFTDNWSVAVTRGFTVAVWAGNFSGRPMQGVSGITGAGPLLHRVVMETAKRVTPGALTTPAEAGAIAVPVCRLSGLRATPECASLTEWFAPGTAPSATDTWERGGAVTLPDEYSAWASQQRHDGVERFAFASSAESADPRAVPTGQPIGVDASVASRPASVAAPTTLHITSPADGDRYAVPTGTEREYASIALRATGPGSRELRWSVDGRAFAKDRWPLEVGAHVFRATSASGAVAEARVEVMP